MFITKRFCCCKKNDVAQWVNLPISRRLHALKRKRHSQTTIATRPTGALPNEQYTVGWICALPTELTAARLFLDELHAERLDEGAATADNTYVLGKIEEHNVVIVTLPYGVYGTSSAATVARDLLRTFENICIGLMVGIGGGAPSPRNNVHLGDVVVSVPQNESGGVFQYKHGKNI